jgi:hypothetical protein
LNTPASLNSEGPSHDVMMARLDLRSIRFEIGDKDKLFLEGIYATGNAMCAVFTDEEPRKTDDVITSSIRYKNPQDLIGYIMRTVIGLAEQVGLRVPCFCILFLNDEDLREKLEKLMANQDWHRGDFGLLVYEGSHIDKKETHVDEVIGFLDYDAFESDLHRISTDDLISKLDQEMKRKRLSSNRMELLEEIKAILKELDEKGIEDDKAFATTLDAWVNTRIEDIERQMNQK